MKKFTTLLTALALALLLCIPARAEGETGCSPKYQAIKDNALVKFHGTGDMDITIVSDPLCWHCRLGHKLLGENPELYRTVNLIFYPRRSFIGSDMAAWILEDAAGDANLREKIDFAYKYLKQPKTDDLNEARDLVLTQFVFQFPDMLKADETVDELAARLEKDNRPHVSMTSKLCREAELPGTPTLLAGQYILMGYGAGPWIKALEEKKLCK